MPTHAVPLRGAAVRRRIVTRAVAFCAAAVLLLGPTRADASPSFPDCRTVIASVPRQWPVPLNRRVSVRAGEVALRDALDRLAATARVRLTYSNALLPLERRVCLDVEDVPLGDVLTALVAGTRVAPRVVGPDLIVLALDASAVVAAETAPAPIRRAAPLERVIVTGSATGGAQRPLTVSVGVVDGSALEAIGAGSMADMLNGSLAGVWLWQQSPTTLTSRYGSTRGASSFGVSYPKVYVDGVEVANPLVVTNVPAESIERLEVLRGPQGAALYGTDAISGVVQLVTRQPSSASETPALRMRMQNGVVNSAYTEGSVLGQEVMLAGQRGDISRAVAGTLTYGRLGDIVPEAQSQHVTASARGRMLGSRSLLEGTARLALADVSAASNPILRSALGDALVLALPDSVRLPRFERRVRDSLAARLQLDRSQRQSLRQLTMGVTGTLNPSARWTHRAMLGVDLYALDGSPGSVIPLPSSSDSALRAAEGSAVRASTRVSSAATWNGEDWRRTVTVSGEHAVLREATSNAVLAGPQSRSDTSLSNALSTNAWRQTTGVVAQLDMAWHNTLFLTGGTRVERSAGFTTQPLVTVLPMVGASVVRDLDAVTLKVRGAYGKGIRPPRITVGGSSLARQRLIPNPDLEPETQTGTEFGVDLFAGRRAAFHVTRFDQRASGLVQPVALLAQPSPPGKPRPGDPLDRNLVYQIQNVGAIDNRGWELEGVLRGGPFVLQGSLSLVDSRVANVRRGYTGELRVGDRMLDVPARTMGLTARFADGGWGAAVQVARVSDWIGYDRLAAGAAYVTPGKTPSTFVGGSLRQFWITYPGVTRVNAMFTRALPYDLTLQFSGENLLDRQVGEPDNITIVPGRSFSVGVRARF